MYKVATLVLVLFMLLLSIDAVKPLADDRGLIIPFIEHDDARYYADTLIGRMLVYDDRIVYMLGEKIIEEYINAHAISPLEESDVIINNFKDNGNEAYKAYNAIVYHMDKVRLELRAYHNNIEKIFVLEPYSDIDEITIRTNHRISIEDGRLVIDDIAFTAPIAYQYIDDRKHYVDVEYKIIDENSYGFSASYDERYTLIIDPLIDLVSSSYLDLDWGASDLAIDKYGNILIAGYDINMSDGLIIKFNNDLDRVISLTYIGGSGYDSISAIEVDRDGNIFIAGATSSSDFPIVNGYDNTSNSDYHGEYTFIAKFDSDLNTLLASTYSDIGSISGGIKLALSNNYVYAAGRNYSCNDYGEDCTQIVKLNYELSQLLASSRIEGGILGNYPESMIADSNDNLFIVIRYPEEGDNGITKLFKLNSELETVAYSGAPPHISDMLIVNDTLYTIGYTEGEYVDDMPTYVNRFDGNLNLEKQMILFELNSTHSRGYIPTSIAIDLQGNIIISGVTGASLTLSYEDVFIIKIDDQLNNILDKLYIGGSSGDYGGELAIDRVGNIYLIGATSSNDFPIINGYDTTFNVIGYRNINSLVARFIDYDTLCSPLPREGYNLILGSESDDIIYGTSRNDIIIGYGGDDTIDSKGGRDIICGGDGDDIINGRGGNDTIYGNNGNDTIYGNGGDDTIRGGYGNDTIYGNSGNDVLLDSDSNDTDRIYGGSGNDHIDTRDSDNSDYGRGGMDPDTVRKDDSDNVKP